MGRTRTSVSRPPTGLSCVAPDESPRCRTRGPWRAAGSSKAVPAAPIAGAAERGTVTEVAKTKAAALKSGEPRPKVAAKRRVSLAVASSSSDQLRAARSQRVPRMKGSVYWESQRQDEGRKREREVINQKVETLFARLKGGIGVEPKAKAAKREQVTPPWRAG